MITLTVQLDDKADLGVNKVDSGDRSTASLDDSNLRGRQGHASDTQNSEVLILKLALGDTRPAQPVLQNRAHDASASPAASGDSMEEVGNRHQVGHLPTQGFIQSPGCQTFTPGAPDIDQAALDGCCWNPHDLCHIANREVGRSVYDIAADGPSF